MARAVSTRGLLIVLLAVAAAVADSGTSMLVALDALDAYAARRARWYESASCVVYWAGRSMLVLCHLTWLALCLGLDATWAAISLGFVRCRCRYGSSRAALFAACRWVGCGARRGGVRCAVRARALPRAGRAVLRRGVRLFRRGTSRRGAAAVLSAGRGLLAGVRPLSAAARCRECAARVVDRMRAGRFRLMVSEGAVALHRAASAADAFLSVLLRRVAVVAAGGSMRLGDGTMRLLRSVYVLASWARRRVTLVLDAVRDAAVVALRWARAGSIGSSWRWGCRAPRDARASSGGGRRRQAWRSGRRTRPRGRSAGEWSLGRAEPCSASAARGGAPGVAGSTASVKCHASCGVSTGCRAVHVGRERCRGADHLNRCAGASSGGACFVAAVALLAPFPELAVRSILGASHLYVRLRLADAIVWVVIRCAVLVWWCLATLVGVSLAAPVRAASVGAAVAMLVVLGSRRASAARGAAPCCRARRCGSGSRDDGVRCDCDARASVRARVESRHAAGVLRGGARDAKRRKVGVPAEPVRRPPEWRNSRPARWQVCLALFLRRVCRGIGPLPSSHPSTSPFHPRVPSVVIGWVRPRACSARSTGIRTRWRATPGSTGFQRRATPWSA